LVQLLQGFLMARDRKMCSRWGGTGSGQLHASRCWLLHGGKSSMAKAIAVKLLMHASFC
jgi:hypothetical protein